MFARAAAFSPALRQRRESKPLPIVGPSSQGEIAKLGSQRSINWYPIKPEREGDPWTLRGRPGFELLDTLSRSNQRGWLVHADRLFVVAGARIYEVYENGSSFEWGKINSSRGRVGMASLLGIIVIGDGSGYYALDLDAGTVTAITDAPRGRWCIFFNQRMLYQGENGEVQYSALVDPLTIEGSFTAESLPDEISKLIATEDMIWIPGPDGSEVWYDSGDETTPFQRVQGSVIYTGTQHPNTVLQLDNSIWMVGKNKQGEGIVWRSSGFNFIRVSTASVERFCEASSEITAFSYEEQGETFYCLNSELGSWAFGIRSGEWHERAWLNPNTGVQERQRPEFHAYVYGQHMAGDYETGKIYRQGLDLHSDAGDEIRRTRVTQKLSFNGRSVILDELWLDFATGIGLDGTGQGTDPKVMLRVSGDGVSFGPELTAELGAVGEYETQVRFFGLGLGRDWVFEISVSDPVITGLMGAEGLIRVGRR